jgi:hypothetical protein
MEAEHRFAEGIGFDCEFRGLADERPRPILQAQRMEAFLSFTLFACSAEL